MAVSIYLGLSSQPILKINTDVGMTDSNIRVAPVELPGRGRGIVAQKNIEQGEALIHIPTQCLITAESTCHMPPALLAHLDDCSVHGQLAGRLAYLVTSDRSDVQPWMNVLPSFEHVRVSMPLLWPQELQSHLPEAAAKLLQKQRKKYGFDLDAASKAFLPALGRELCKTIEQTRQLYSCSWCLVNSRSFYWDISSAAGGAKGRPKRKKTRPRDRDDCMALCPIIDCFNHSDVEDCHVEYNEQGFSVVSSHYVEAGTELYVSYGKHSNDFLLVEYGFILDENRDDHVFIDRTVLERLSDSQKDALEGANLLGAYVVDAANGACYRTQAALRIVCLPRRRWEQFVKGIDDGEKEQSRIDRLFAEVLKVDAATASTHLQRLAKLTEADSNVQETLVQRWNQIKEILDANMQNTQDV